MSITRKKYSPSEKAKIALEAIKSEMTLAQITAKYGVHATQVTSWKKQALAYLPDAFIDKIGCPISIYHYTQDLLFVLSEKKLLFILIIV